MHTSLTTCVFLRLVGTGQMRKTLYGCLTAPCMKCSKVFPAATHRCRPLQITVSSRCCPRLHERSEPETSADEGPGNVYSSRLGRTSAWRHDQTAISIAAGGSEPCCDDGTPVSSSQPHQMTPQKTPSCSPGSRLTRFCSQLSRSFAASFCMSYQSRALYVQYRWWESEDT